jgi:hypothetical protein
MTIHELAASWHIWLTFLVVGFLWLQVKALTNG